MSLKIFVPLNNTINNYGPSGGTTSGSPTYSNTGGRLGGGKYSFDSANISFSDTTNLSVINGCTVSVWIYPTAANGDIYSNISGGPVNFAFGISSLKPYVYHYNSRWLSTLSTTTVPLNTWTHITWVCKSNTVYFYINGELKGSGDCSVSSGYTGNIPMNVLGSRWSGGQKFQGALQDFRVYDDALSSNDIHWLGMKEVGHWTFSEVNAEAAALRSGLSSVTWNQLINPSRLNNTSVNGVTCVVNKINGSVVCNGTATAYSVLNIGLGTNTTTTGHKYLLIGCPKGGYNADVTAANGGTYDLRLNIGSYFSDIGDGVIFNGGLNANIYIRVANGYNCQNITFHPMLFDLTTIFGSGNEPTAAEFKQMFPLHYYPYDSGTTKDLRLPIPDISGNHNDLTINGTCSVSTGSKRYSKCIHINDINSWMYTNIQLPITNGVSVCGWVKISAWGLQTSGLFATGSTYAFVDYANTTFNHRDSGFDIRGTNGTTYRLTCDTNDVPLNTWIHVALVHDGAKARLYINGVEKRSIDVPTPLVASEYFGIGHSNAGGSNRTSIGDYSDVRLYATALSASDVQYLYSLGN